MVLRVPGVELIDLVVRVGDDRGRLDVVESHGLELEPGHGAVRIGQEHLVHPEADLLAGYRRARDQMPGQELLDEALRHQAPRSDNGRNPRAAGPT